MALFIPISKVDVAKQLVYGTLSEEVPDKTGEILDYETAKPAFAEWSQQFQDASGGKSFGNVRAMHGNVAAGKFTDISFDDVNKRIQGVAKIIDDAEWQKVLEGVYTGFSIGGGYAKRWQDAENSNLMRYTPVLSEVSLVDNPAVPTATFEVIKLDGTTECRKFNAAQDNSDMNEADDEEKISALLEGLSWLADDIANEDEADEVLPHILALQQYLNGEAIESDESNEKLTKSIDSHLSTIEELQKRITQLESLPLPPKGVLRAISKSEDRSNHEETFAKLSAAGTPHELMKVALSNPILI